MTRSISARLTRISRTDHYAADNATGKASGDTLRVANGRVSRAGTRSSSWEVCLRQGIRGGRGRSDGRRNIFPKAGIDQKISSFRMLWLLARSAATWSAISAVSVVRSCLSRSIGRATMRAGAASALSRREAKKQKSKELKRAQGRSSLFLCPFASLRLRASGAVRDDASANAPSAAGARQ